MRKEYLYWRYLFGCLVILTGLFLGVPGAVAQQASITPTSTPLQVRILSPLPGQALRGSVGILVFTGVPDFRSAEISFAYSGNPTRTWFPIGQFDKPMEGGEAVNWDTTTLTDGNYTLQLVVTLVDGAQVTTRVENLRVRNYSPVETDTPTPSLTPAPGEPPTPTPTLTPSQTPVYLTPTPIPANPIELSARDIPAGLAKGALGVVTLFALLGLYGSLRKWWRP